MVFGNIKNREYYTCLGDAVCRCMDYAEKHDLEAMETGSHPIEGDDLFVNIVEYETTTPEERFWEAHRYYLDLHLMIHGVEQIDTGFIDSMIQKPFVENDDFLPLEGEPNGCGILREGDFLLCYPTDAHRTAVAVHEPVKIKKAIFKIKIR